MRFPFCLFICLVVASTSSRSFLDDPLTDNAIDGQRAGATGGGGLIPTDISSLQSGFGPLMNTMKDGKLVIGGFSFVVIPNPDATQLASMAQGGIPFTGALPGAG